MTLLRNKSCLTPYVFCVGVLTAVLGFALAQAASDIEKPSLYRLSLSNDGRLCQSIKALINKDIETSGQIHFLDHPMFLKWDIVKGNKSAITHPAPEDVFETIVDLDNDGILEHVFKGISSIRGFNVDTLFVFSSERAIALRKAGVDYERLFEADRRIDFFDGRSWIERAKAKYGKDWEAWVPGPLSIFQIFRYQNATYILGYNPSASRDQSAEVYVFQALPDNEIRDVCMLHRVCPCGGCKDLRGRQVDQRLPASPWCRN